jgi:hypothetical protein
LRNNNADHFSASVEPGSWLVWQKMAAKKPSIKNDVLGTERRCCRAATVANDHGSGIASTQPK